MAIETLVRKYISQREEIIKTNSPYNETQVRSDYLDLLFKDLGWDIDNNKELSERLRDVTLEYSFKGEDETTKRPDYSFQVQGKRIFFLEAKKPSVNLTENKKVAFQVKSYGWTSKLDFSVLCNFEKLVIYDCRTLPSPEDHPTKGVYKSFSYDELEENWDEVFSLLSYESISTGQSPLLKLKEKQKGELSFDDFFLGMLEEWRIKLAQDLIKNNPKIESSVLNHYLQALFNRILFLRICEEHEYEKFERLKTVSDYESLKALFLEADKKYNSGIFKLIEDGYGLDVGIESQKLIQFFSALYYPESPYSFSVLSPEILGSIYEEYIGKTLIIEDGKLQLLEKPEVKESGGVISTPYWIAYKIVSEALLPIISNLSINDILNKKIADICVGSGVFLSAAMDVLCEVIVSKVLESCDNPDLEQFVYPTKNGELKPSLHLKHHIVTNCLIGVDIDSQAVETCKFGLLLKMLEGETPESLGDFFEKYHVEALPDLDSVIVSGNSLVTHADYAGFKGINKIEALYSVNPFNLKDFLNSKGGVDLIVGNPPYIRIQKMIKYAEPEVKFYKSKKSNFVTSKGIFDKYFLFLEKSIEVLRDSGHLSYIIPNKFLSSKNGSSLRKFLIDNSIVEEVTNFGSLLLFDKADVYNCIVKLKKGQANNYNTSYKGVTDIADWLTNSVESVNVEKQSLSDSNWIFAPPEISAIFSSLQSNIYTCPLENITKIFVGLQTSNDPVYVIKKTSEDENFVYFKNKEEEVEKVEKDILLPCLYDQKFEGIEVPRAEALMIFPYKIEDGKAKVFEEDYFKESYPCCWEYLSKFKVELSSRSIEPKKNAMWYQFGRSQSLTKFDGERKIIWPVLSLRPTYSIDSKNTLFTGGGNGPYYGLKKKEGVDESLEYISACLRFPPVDALVMNYSSKFRGGYGSHGKQYVKTLPIRRINFESEKHLHDEITSKTNEILEYERGLQSLDAHRRELVLKQIETIRDEINTILCNLYNISQDNYQRIVRFFYEGQ
ncbi:Eco57I restriction-modification methylase domain-containing protein [Halobacteriovorax sp.]|uniref:Eco57I restriction-modification methylase domain-containing protein n=1 Tax=Halobacteriovorax sp. TaxID=2020862 RepID=UPI003AF1F5BE